MLVPILVLTGILSVITAPGLIAQHLEERRKVRRSDGAKTGVSNA